MTTTRPVPRSGIALRTVWVLAALSVGALGWLSFAISERPADRLAGALLLGIAILAGVTAVVLCTGHRSRALSLITSAVLILGGAAVGLIVSATAFTSDVLLLSGIPVAAGLVTGLLTLRGTTDA